MLLLPILTALSFEGSAARRGEAGFSTAVFSAGDGAPQAGPAAASAELGGDPAAGSASSGSRVPLLSRWLSRAEPLRPWCFAAWLIGVFFLSLLHAAGWRRLRRLCRVGVRPVPPEWEEVASRISLRLGLPRAVRVLQSSLVEVPAIVGYFSPVLLIPASALTGLAPEQLRGIIAHELAHVKRRDYLVNLLQIVAETLLFFHPALWWVSRRIRAERENCCDDMAIAQGEDRLAFARALVSLESLRPRYENLALRADGGSLRQRVHRLLGVDAMTDTSNRPWLSGIFLASLLIAGAAVLSLAVADTRVAGVQSPPPTIQLASSALADTEDDFAVEGRWESERISGVSILTLQSRQRGDRMQMSLRLSDAEQREFESGPDGFVLRRDAGSFTFSGEWDGSGDIEGEGRFGFVPDREFQRKVGIRGLKDRELLILAARDVGYAYLAALDELGYGKPDDDDLMALTIHGVSIEFIEEMRAIGYEPSLDRCVEWRIHGVSPDFARRMAEAGYETVDGDQLVEWRIHGVSPEFVEGMKKAGVRGLNVDELTAMRIHGVSVDFVRDLDELGYAELEADDLVAMRIHGVSTSYIQRILDKTNENPSVDDLIKMKIHGIRL
jgi:beta-lactamase regulating signal transducer with metallopeptidase domain